MRGHLQSEVQSSCGGTEPGQTAPLGVVPAAVAPAASLPDGFGAPQADEAGRSCRCHGGSGNAPDSLGGPDSGAVPALSAEGDGSVGIFAGALILLIRLYQKTLSPLLPECCRFYPTCSCYAVEALRTHGFIKGTALTVWRLMRCQPFCRGGYDPVPPPKIREHKQ